MPEQNWTVYAFTSTTRGFPVSRDEQGDFGMGKPHYDPSPIPDTQLPDVTQFLRTYYGRDLVHIKLFPTL